MEQRLEVVFVPVSDVDRATAFYRDKVGFVQDFDTGFGEAVRMVQLTPPGSGCSIAFVHGMTQIPGRQEMEPGSLSGLMLVVPDITAARNSLLENGVEVSEVMEVVHEEGRSVYRRPEGEPRGWNAYAFFDDPDGNAWILQESPPDEEIGATPTDAVDDPPAP